MNEIAIFLPNIIYQNGEQFTTDASTHHKLPFIAKEYDRVHLVTFVSMTPERCGREPLSFGPNIKLHQLPSVQNGWQLYFTRLHLWATAMLKITGRNRKTFKAALIIDSGLPSYWFFLCCRWAGIPTALYLRGRADVSIVNVDRNMQGIRRRLAPILARGHRWAGEQMARLSPTVVDHDELLEEFRGRGVNVWPIVATILRENNIAALQPIASVQPEPLRLISVGRVVYLKGLHVLLQALHYLKEINCYFHLSIVGPLDQEYGKLLRQNVQVLGLEEDIEFLGPVQHGKELYRLLRQSEIFVLPSFTEGSPKTIPEALSQGLVVVASNVGSLSRILGDGEAGFLLPPGDALEMARLLYRLAQDPKLRATMAQRALKRSKELTMEAQLCHIVSTINAASISMKAD